VPYIVKTENQIQITINMKTIVRQNHDYSYVSFLTYR